MKFKKGDRVRVKRFKRRPEGWNDSGKMDHLMGNIVTISAVDKTIDCYLVWDEENSTDWLLKKNELEPVNESIVIYCKGREVIALDKRTGKKAVARCCPQDTFDFETGANLAFERLFPESKVKEVKRCAKPGEYIKIVHASGCSMDEYKNGDILKVVTHDDDTPDIGRAYYKDERCKYASPEEYVVLEGYEPQVEKTFYKVGDRVCIKSWEQMEKEYGLDSAGNIKTKVNFVKSMKKYCGKVLTIEHIDSDSVITMPGLYWDFSPDMIDCKVEDEPTYYNGKIIFTKGDSVFKAGHIYEIKDGKLACPWDGKELPSNSFFENIDDVRDYFTAQHKRKKNFGWSQRGLSFIEVKNG